MWKEPGGVMDPEMCMYVWAQLLRVHAPSPLPSAPSWSASMAESCLTQSHSLPNMTHIQRLGYRGPAIWAPQKTTLMIISVLEALPVKHPSLLNIHKHPAASQSSLPGEPKTAKRLKKCSQELGTTVMKMIAMPFGEKLLHIVHITKYELILYVLSTYFAPGTVLVTEMETLTKQCVLSSKED